MNELQIREILGRYGKYDLVKTISNVSPDKEQNRNHKTNSTFEYLYILENI